jgi:tRNA A37 threonylcarbamoyladenosine dehydratase
MFPSPPGQTKEVSLTYDRQARVFGDRGQAILSKQRVGIIGLGGVGSIVCEYLSRLGVGSVVLVDPDRVDPTSTPRVVGSSPWDAITGLSGRERASWFRRLLARLARLKVDIAAREARRANPAIEIIRHASSVVEEKVARSLSTCDYLFLAADSMQARLVFNSLVHQYLIPGIQLGAKVPVDPVSGEVGRIYSVVRPVLPGRGCLWCNGLITSDGLQQEALSPEERKAQRYVEDDDIPAPSVVTLNALAAAHGVNDYLFRSVGLRVPSCSDDYIFVEPRTGTVRLDTPRRDSDCPECSAVSASRFARGDGRPLPVSSR